MSLSVRYLFLFLFISSTNAWYGDGSFFDWIWPHSKEARKEIGTNSPLIPVPFESKTDDEKFLEEASKFTDIIKSSALDSCQHKVVLKIKTSCSSMTEEELAKMSVNLLNCQSAVDGRKMFPCSDSMSLKQCTEKMDPTMWNAYHMMNNRARAVCLAARRSQFQALSEMTVNKLMSAAHNQIRKMDTIVKSQNDLEKLTLGTISIIEKGNIALLKQQDQLKSSQQGINDFISHNLLELVKEKALIAAGHKELAGMTQKIKEKMDEANIQLYEQAEERVEHHKQLLADIDSIQKLTKEIFHRIDSSTDKLLLQHTEAATKFEETVKNLVKINETIQYLLKLVNRTRSEIDDKFHWIQSFLDDTGLQLEKISTIAYHIAYLLIGMLLASFLNLSTLSRFVLTLLVPTNLFLSYIDRTDLVLDYVQMTGALFGTVLVITLINKLGSSHHQSSINYSSVDDNMLRKVEGNRRTKSNKWFGFRRFLDKIISWFSSFTQRSNDHDDDDGVGELYQNGGYIFDREEDLYRSLADRGREVSSHSLVRDWLQNKVTTPPSGSSVSSKSRRACSAISRLSGQQCRNPNIPGKKYCVRHRRNNFEIGELD